MQLVDLPFDDAIKDLTGGHYKVKSGDYLPEGPLPVIDQGKGMIAGYTKDLSCAFTGELPVVVFGDHTGAIKFVDFPFALGADGIKVLRPIKGIDPKFFFHFLRHKGVPDTGYDRKFKYLRRSRVQFPPLEEQKRIAALLDKAEEIIAKRRAALALLDQLPQSLFLEMFGDPASNPKLWPKLPFCEIASTRLGKMLDKKKQSDENPLPYLGNSNVQWFTFDLRTVQCMTFNEKERSMLRLAPGDVLICEGGEPGRCAVWAGELQECYFQKAIHRARVDESRVLPYFVTHCLFNLAVRGGLKDFVTVATIAHLTGEKLATLPFPIPPIDLQQRFAARVEAIHHAKAAHQAALRDLNALFDSMQAETFEGRVNEKELSHV